VGVSLIPRERITRNPCDGDGPLAATNFGVNDPLAVKLWSKKLTVEVLKETWIMNFAGTNSDSMVQIKDETQKSAGDKITYGLRMQLLSAGVQGDGTLNNFGRLAA
jgi:hypothetical protein